MVKVVMGLKGSGKTKQLIESINTAIKTETGSMVCIEKGNNLTFDIDYRVRLVESSEYLMNNYDFLKGFISGLHAGNFDITHIFIDRLYKIVGCEDPDQAAEFLAWCEEFGKANKLEFTVTISAAVDSATDGIRKFF